MVWVSDNLTAYGDQPLRNQHQKTKCLHWHDPQQINTFAYFGKCYTIDIQFRDAASTI